MKRLLARLRRMVSGQHIEPERPPASGVRAPGAHAEGRCQPGQHFWIDGRAQCLWCPVRRGRHIWPETGSTDPRTEDPRG